MLFLIISSALFIAMIVTIFLITTRTNKTGQDVQQELPMQSYMVGIAIFVMLNTLTDLGSYPIVQTLNLAFLAFIVGSLVNYYKRAREAM